MCCLLISLIISWLYHYMFALHIAWNLDIYYHYIINWLIFLLRLWLHLSVSHLCICDIVVHGLLLFASHKMRCFHPDYLIIIIMISLLQTHIYVTLYIILYLQDWLYWLYINMEFYGLCIQSFEDYAIPNKMHLSEWLFLHL